MKVVVILLAVVVGILVVIQGLSLVAQSNYVRRDEVEQLVYDIMGKRQDRDAQVQWAQLQWLTRLHIKYYPKDTLWLDDYRNYWEKRALKRWLEWTAGRLDNIK